MPREVDLLTCLTFYVCLLQSAFALPRKLLTEAARYFVQAPKSPNSASPGVSLLDRIEMCCRSNVQLPRGLRDRSDFIFLKSGR